MSKLNQIVAVVAGKKTRSEKEFGEINKALQKPDLFSGLARTYRPLADDDREKLAAESKFPQKSASDAIMDARRILRGIIDAVATQEYGNTGARADVVVDGVVILPQVPVTVLLYLDKILNDLTTFVGNIPTLDPAEQWTYSSDQGRYETAPTTSYRTKKLQKPLVLFPATPEHPAQTQLVTEDVVVGEWTTTKYSTAVTPTAKRAIQDNIVKLQEAVKLAREQANLADVSDQFVADSVLKFVFGN